MAKKTIIAEDEIVKLEGKRATLVQQRSTLVDKWRNDELLIKEYNTDINRIGRTIEGLQEMIDEG